MKKVLHILNGLGTGGAESFIINTLKATQNKNISHDVMIRSSIDSKRKQFESFGGKVYSAPSFPKKIVENFFYVKNFFENHTYDYVHIHMNSMVYTIPLYFLKNKKQTKIIVHSHNSQTSGILSRAIHFFNKKMLKSFPFITIACSSSAGNWMFDRPFSIIVNSIDIKLFKFDKLKRQSIRNYHSILDDTILLGNVGRLESQKNQIFLLHLMKKLINFSTKYRLIIIGDGSLHSYLLDYVIQNKLEKFVIFTGNVENIFDYYSALDIFLMPSLYEGYPIALIESQVSGLPAVINNNIATDSLNTENLMKVSSLKIHTDTDIWIKKIRSVNVKKERNINQENLDDFSLEHLEKEMINLYK